MTDFEKGTRVKILHGGNYNRSKYGREIVIADSVGVTTSQVKGYYVSVKFDDFDCVVRVPIDDLIPEDPNAPHPRVAGTPPDGMLSPLDPRLSWLWDDAAKLADKMSLCSDYDKFTRALGVPGRPKNYTVTTTINGFTASVVVKARSQAEADKMVLGTEVETK